MDRFKLLALVEYTPVRATRTGNDVTSNDTASGHHSSASGDDSRFTSGERDTRAGGLFTDF